MRVFLRIVSLVNDCFLIRPCRCSLQAEVGPGGLHVPEHKGL
jgi:hypothetical protein